MSDTPWILENFKTEDIAPQLKELLAIYKEYGVLIFPGMLKNNAAYIGFLSSLRFLFYKILTRHNIPFRDDEDLGDLLIKLQNVSAESGKIIANMCTQHNKLVEANRLKYADFVTTLLYAIWGKDAVLATPQASDTLILLMPGKEFKKYSLPIHQDYQYLMQSPAQITMYMGISNYYDGVGGLEYWPKSQELGILKSDRNENKSFRVFDEADVEKKYSTHKYYWNVGDVSIFDSLMCHRSIPNTSKDKSRIVQLFRYSNLNNPVAESYDWQSYVYPRHGITFEEFHSDLYVKS